MMDFDSLSAKEFATLKLVVMGVSNKEVAERLKIPEATVKFRLTNIYRKAGTKNRGVLIARYNAWQQQERHTTTLRDIKCAVQKLRNNITLEDSVMPRLQLLSYLDKMESILNEVSMYGTEPKVVLESPLPRGRDNWT